MDVLSDILAGLKVEATAIATFALGEPWAFDIDRFSPAYCFSVVEGKCWVVPEGAAGRWLYPGDSVVWPCRGACVLAAAPGVPPVPVLTAWQANGLPVYGESTFVSPVTLRWGGDGATTRIIGLIFGFNGMAHRALLSALPNFFYVAAQESAGYPWLRSAMDFLSAEEGAGRPGYGVLACELATLIFTSLVRAHILTARDHPPGWLRALSDPKITRALSAIHGQPQKPWSLTDLAAQAGMSRSGFATRFAALVGQSPVAYLAGWRIHLAAEKLVHEKTKIAQLAEDLGYGSERAFRTAFKQQMGATPQAYRKRMSAI